MTSNTYTAAYLTQYIKSVFLAMGGTDADAQQAAEVLIAADLRGVDSHGVARLSGYVKLW
ncbi:MAG: Ldh family oxidoreductase, partial [Breznakibacter sp.]|nr:Ldh family oxidoreductase [Breznakibacter sp.]